MTALRLKPSILTHTFIIVQRFQAAKTLALALTVALAAIFFQSAHAENLALNKVATAISSAGDHPPSFACDGNYNGFVWPNFFHISGTALKPWLTVDLGDVFRVRMIAVLNQEKNTSNAWKLGPSELRVGNSTNPDENESCGVTVMDWGFYDCRLKGRYVTLRRTSNVV